MKNFISPSARLGKQTTVGMNAVISDEVSIGDHTHIGHNVVIYPRVEIGSHVRIDDNTVIGKQPMKSIISATTSDQMKPPTVIGDHCIIGTSVVIYAGCILGEKVLVADLSSVREDVTIGVGTIIGRGVAVENKSTVGSYCKLETMSTLPLTRSWKIGVFCHRVSPQAMIISSGGRRNALSTTRV